MSCAFGRGFEDGFRGHLDLMTGVDDCRNSIRTILVVDDEEIVREFSATVLRDCGYRVVVAASAAEAISLSSLDLDGLALLFTDVVMPGMSGVELACKLRELNPDLAVLFTSGYVDHEVLADALSRGVSGFIRKPFQVDALIAKVGEMVANARIA